MIRRKVFKIPILIDECMVEKQVEINSKVLNTLLEIVNEENIPLDIEVGLKHINDDRSVSFDVLYEYDYKDAELINEIICRAINMTLDLCDD